MSLSASEKVRVVQALDALGVQLIEAGFPDSNPKELELFERLAEVPLEQATIAAFGMTRRRDDRAPRRIPGLQRARRLLRAGRDAGRQDLGAAPGEGDAGLARGEPGDDRRLGPLLCGAGQAGRSTTPSTSSTAGATTPATRRECLRGGRRGRRRERERSATPTAPASRMRSRRRRRPWSPLLGARRPLGRHPHPQRRRVRRGQLASRPSAPERRSSRARSTATGSGPATPTSSRSCRPCSSSSATSASSRERLRLADRDRAPDRRDLQPVAGSRPALRRPQRLRPQGRHARRRRRPPTPAPSSTWIPPTSATAARS